MPVAVEPIMMTRAPELFIVKQALTLIAALVAAANAVSERNDMIG